MAITTNAEEETVAVYPIVLLVQTQMIIVHTLDPTIIQAVVITLILVQVAVQAVVVDSLVVEVAEVEVVAVGAVNK